MIEFATRTAMAAAHRVPVLSTLLRRARAARAPGALWPAPDDGWLPDAIRVESLHCYDVNHRPGRVRPVEFVVIHYTASPPGSGPQGSDLGRIQRWATRQDRKSSTHFVILRDGRLVQMVPLNARAWHVTRRWPWPGDGHGNINTRSIGIDFENVGWLRDRADGLINAYGGRHLGEVGRDDAGKPWEPYTTAQIETMKRLLGRLGALYPQLRDGNPLRIIGHTDAQPTRPDPGPLCPMGELRAALMGAH